MPHIALQMRQNEVTSRVLTIPYVAPFEQCSAEYDGKVFVDSSAVAVGSIAPDFSLPDASGRVTTLSEFRGRPVVLVFLRGFL
jgi:cytochrome oxidase Cu insertion factor (SCO1/SenC/PrrC family)